MLKYDLEIKTLLSAPIYLQSSSQASSDEWVSGVCQLLMEISPQFVPIISVATEIHAHGEMSEADLIISKSYWLTRSEAEEDEKS